MLFIPPCQGSKHSSSGTQKRAAETLRKVEAAEKGKTYERHHHHQVSVRNAIPHCVQGTQPLLQDASSTHIATRRDHVRHDLDPTTRRLGDWVRFRRSTFDCVGIARTRDVGPAGYNKFHRFFDTDFEKRNVFRRQVDQVS